MFRRSAALGFRATPVALSGGDGHHSTINKVKTNVPGHTTNAPLKAYSNTSGYAKKVGGYLPQKMFDTDAPLYDDTVSAAPRFRWQDPVRTWHQFNVHDVILLEEHDKEEWNERPYVGVSHLYSPPVGSKERPNVIYSMATPGTLNNFFCAGNCAPHVPAADLFQRMKGYSTTECGFCGQFFYVHDRPWLVIHPDWTDEPADDEGPAFTFAEVEAEFDRDFHEFSIFLTNE